MGPAPGTALRLTAQLLEFEFDLARLLDAAVHHVDHDVRHHERGHDDGDRVHVHDEHHEPRDYPPPTRHRGESALRESIDIVADNGVR